MKSKYKFLAVVGAAMLLASCNDYLDREPMSSITSNAYFSSDSQLDTYVMKNYPNLYDHIAACGFNTLLGSDSQTDDKTYLKEEVALYATGASGVSVPSSGGVWDFKALRSCNYFFEEVLPRYEAGAISGSDETIRHYIGEMYFFRAYETFRLYQELGDMPIADAVPSMDVNQLIENSVRQPRNEVARFILDDLDRAYDYMMAVSPDGHKERLNKAAARLFKSRVALFEGSWLKYFAGTAFVPNGPGWPGETIHAGYSFPAGSIEAESQWFLQQAADAAKEVADAYPLTPQNSDFSLQQSESGEANPYFDMFGNGVDLSGYDEIIVWKDYDRALGIDHGTAVAAGTGNNNYGVTKGLIESFVMDNGLPIYADGSGYAGDDTTFDVIKNRDGRLKLFLKVPNQINKIINPEMNTPNPTVEPVPILFHASFAYISGYALRKFGTFDGAQFGVMLTDTGCPLFRASEAYLNYMEASYMATGSVDGTAAEYWKELRARANVDTDFNKTIAATDMAKEALGDWGAYSAGQLIDPTLYNIRRERRNELMSEGFRMNDIRRWRSMDQLMANPYIIQGFKLWNSTMNKWYTEGYTYADGTKSDPVDLKVRGEDGAFLSPAEDGDYLCPLRIIATHANFDGYTWQMPHYLTPIAAHHFTMVGGDESVIYQNPGWDILGGSNAGTL